MPRPPQVLQEVEVGEVLRLKNLKEPATVLAPCEASHNGRWLCVTHDELFANQLQKDLHIHDGTHRLAWVCYEHGIERAAKTLPMKVVPSKADRPKKIGDGGFQHMTMTREYLLRMFDSYPDDWNKIVSGATSREEAREFIRNGPTILPVGDCPGFTVEGGCPGHTRRTPTPPRPPKKKDRRRGNDDGPPELKKLLSF